MTAYDVFVAVSWLFIAASLFCLAGLMVYLGLGYWITAKSRWSMITDAYTAGMKAGIALERDKPKPLDADTTTAPSGQHSGATARER